MAGHNRRMQNDDELIRKVDLQVKRYTHLRDLWRLRLIASLHSQEKPTRIHRPFFLLFLLISAGIFFN